MSASAATEQAPKPLLKNSLLYGSFRRNVYRNIDEVRCIKRTAMEQAKIQPKLMAMGHLYHEVIISTFTIIVPDRP